MQGAALLSVPTREYLQSSGWVEPVGAPVGSAMTATWRGEGAGVGELGVADPGGFSSVRTGSGFWANGRPRSGVTVTGSEGSQWTGSGNGSGVGEDGGGEGRVDENGVRGEGCEGEGEGEVEGDSDSRRTSVETERGGSGNGHATAVANGHANGHGRRNGMGVEEEETQEVKDAVGAHEAFVAGMVFALCQRVVPGRPYVREGPGGRGIGVGQGGGVAQGGQGVGASGGAGAGADVLPGGSGNSSGRWRLEECLRCVCPCRVFFVFFRLRGVLT